MISNSEDLTDSCIGRIDKCVRDWWPITVYPNGANTPKTSASPFTRPHRSDAKLCMWISRALGANKQIIDFNYLSQQSIFVNAIGRRAVQQNLPVQLRFALSCSRCVVFMRVKLEKGSLGASSTTRKDEGTAAICYVD